MAGQRQPVDLGIGGTGHRRGVALFALAGLASLALTGCHDAVADKSVEARAAPPPAMTVSATPARREILSRTVTAIGTVAPWQDVVIGAQVNGLAVVKVMIQENDVVRTGDLLVKLDDRSLKAQVAQQTAAVAEARANLEAAQLVSARGDILVAQRVLSLETVQTRHTTTITCQAKLAQAVAALEQLQSQLDKTEVLAPVDGVVSQTPIVIGSVVQVGAELVRIIRDGRLELQAKVPERDLWSLQRGQPARVTAPAGDTVLGDVREIAAEVDPGTRLGIAYVSLPSRSSFRAGMFARVVLTIGHRDVLTVPEQALVWRNGKAATFMLGLNNVAALTPVVTGNRQAGRVAIEAGLNEGDRVVSDGAGFLRDGDRVRVQPP